MTDTDLAAPLTPTDMQRLVWLRGKIEAKIWLGQQQDTVSGHEASRLSFTRWLVQTRRLTES